MRKQDFVEEIVDCVNTTWADKEDHLKRIFLRHHREFSREAVENLVYGDYLSRGGYRERERIVGWIFTDKDMYAHNKAIDAASCDYCISAESGHNVHCRNFREALNA